MLRKDAGGVYPESSKGPVREDDRRQQRGCVRVRLFFFDRLANRVQDEQELIRRRDAAEHAHLLEDLELPSRHLVTRQRPAIAGKLAPCVFLPFGGRRLAIITAPPCPRGRGGKNHPLLVESGRFPQPRQQRQGRAAPSV